ncbi:Spaf_1101 family AAA-like ATPase [Gracilibacillus massiliensis]|uniref:Spaf_1101 family AAA-like ATPase n=1 Tax=Gracilibacillus massiliensis TaxID=1564956 RepID=UPI00071E43AC|nr:AAA family ATPase [Gracilibacillus massiliensis]
MNDNLARVYKVLENEKRTYGHLLKTEFHIHTPASHDYELIENNKFNNMTLNEVIQVAQERELYSQEFVDKYLLKSSHAKEILQDMKNEFDTEFDSLKELLGYQLIAHTLYKNNIEVAVVSDHNTIKGFKKLTAAVVEYYKSRLRSDKNQRCIRLFLGIEISCSDRYHLVSIFDHHKYGEVEEFIKEFIHSEEEGTYISCLDMLKRVVDYNGICYIAHINSSNYLGTKLYKKALFGSNDLNILGLTNLEAKSTQIAKINELQGKMAEKFCYIYEGDSHRLDEIGIKNTWIKFNNVNFKSLKKAFKNHTYCIYTDKPTFNNRFIKGIYIEPGKDGFLTTNRKNSDPFIVDFSRDLNCIIGGRGVGKSTILNILETAFTLEYSSISFLQFISSHNIIYIVFYYKGMDYILEFLPQTGNGGYINTQYFLDKAFPENDKNNYKLSLAPHWVTLYRVKNHDNNTSFVEVNKRSSQEIMNQVYKKSYSINNIIEQINSGKISDFVKEIIFNGERFIEAFDIIKKLKSYNKVNYRKNLREELDFIIKTINNRKDLVNKTIERFNKANHDCLQIKYYNEEISPDYYTDFLEISYNQSFEIGFSKNVLNTHLTWDDVERFLLKAIDEFGYLEFLKMLLNKDHQKIERKISIKKYVSGITKEGYEEINSDNIRKIYNQIEKRIFRDISNVTKSIESLMHMIDSFELEFNINMKESVKSEKVLMKNIEELSLGQKVVAILTFLFNYGEYSNDSTPLVIDQPEDNLDNIYIYQNLDKSLRRIKNKRQVIISTHSSTIVTNADAEQVIILDSDNHNGWVVKKGYPDSEIVLGHIVSVLEGGKDSFAHKKDTYETVLGI